MLNIKSLKIEEHRKLLQQRFAPSFHNHPLFELIFDKLEAIYAVNPSFYNAAIRVLDDILFIVKKKPEYSQFALESYRDYLDERLKMAKRVRPLREELKKLNMEEYLEAVKIFNN